MAFKKAKAEQAYLKLAMYGPPGSGKTFTALLIAEGLAKREGKRVAYVDTERGTDFYAQEVATRRVHPGAFDFDALYTRSLTEVIAELGRLGPEHGVAVVDSMTHLWEAAKLAYQGKTNSRDQLPMWAWQKIKEPWKRLMAFVVNSPMHVLILGRQGNSFSEDEGGELKATGYKMKAEAETAYEPHVLLRMASAEGGGKGKLKQAVVTAFVEKDRTGVLHGRPIEWPSYDNVAKPILPYLGGSQAQVQSEEEAQVQDADALTREEQQAGRRSAEHRERFAARFRLAQDEAALREVACAVKAVKREVQAADDVLLKTAYRAAEARIKNQRPEPQPQPEEISR